MKYNSPWIKVLNKRNILKIVHENRPVSRSEISEITGLTPSSVTRITKELIEEGFVQEIGSEGKNSPGRRRILLDIKNEAFLSLVFDVGVNVTTYGLGYFDGTVSLGGSFETPRAPEKFFMKVREIFEKYSLDNKISRVSLSVPGMVNMEENRILMAPNLGWRDVSINELLQLDVPILADNEANLSVLAEKYHSADMKDVKEAVFIVVREGVGTGVLIDGKLYRGPTYTAGEAGHMTVDMHSNRRCHCSNKGCWEFYASINWAIEHYEGKLDGKNAIEKFAALKKREDSRKVLEKLAQNIAIGIVNIVNILNPEIVILGGEVQDLGEYFYRIIQEEVKRRALKDAAKQLKIRPSIFGTISSNLVGAAVLAVENIIENVK